MAAIMSHSPTFAAMQEKRNILITGGAGFIGSELGRLLSADGHTVHVLDDLSFGRRALAGVPDERFYKVDIRDRKEVLEVIQRIQPDWVLHLAAIHFIPFCNQHPVEAADININGTIHVLDACAATPSVTPKCSLRAQQRSIPSRMELLMRNTSPDQWIFMGLPNLRENAWSENSIIAQVFPLL